MTSQYNSLLNMLLIISKMNSFFGGGVPSTCKNMSISILEKKSILGVRENFAKYFKLLFKQPAIWMFDTIWLKNKKTLKMTLRNISCFSIVDLVLSLSFSLMNLHHFKILFTFQGTFWFSLGGQYAMFIWIFVGRHKIKTGTLQ